MLHYMLSPGEGDGNPFQYSCLENPMDGGAWWARVHGSQRVGHNWATSLSLHFMCFLRVMTIFVEVIQLINGIKELLLLLIFKS